jgi:hypothetical protein
MTSSQALTADAVKQNSSAITEVKVVAQTTGAISSQTSENHWTIFLVLSSSVCIRINMRAKSYDDPTGVLAWSRLPYIRSNSELRSWRYTPIQSIKVRDVAKLIYEYRRDKYEMSGGGSGCRYWVYVAHIGL